MQAHKKDESVFRMLQSERERCILVAEKVVRELEKLPKGSLAVNSGASGGNPAASCSNWASLRRRRAGMNSAEMSKGTSATLTPCSRDDSMRVAGKMVLVSRIQTAAMTGVPGLR